MNEDTVTSKEALFMLDTSMEQDMDNYKQEITLHAIKHINKTPKLYENCKGRDGWGIKMQCVNSAKNNNDELGDLFITELEDVNWNEVAKRV